jgi:hypothetical protein
VNETVRLPSERPAAVPSLVLSPYKPITMGDGMTPFIILLLRYVGSSNPSVGQMHVHGSRGSIGMSTSSQRGFPDEQVGHPHDPHAYKSKGPFVHPSLPIPISV